MRSRRDIAWPGYAADRDALYVMGSAPDHKVIHDGDNG
jgi:hypothetical protein